MKTKKVRKTDYQVYESFDGTYMICGIEHPGTNRIFGGDSACEDHYDRLYIEAIFDQWDGTLYNDTHYGWIINN